jgi:hypothetical protein
MLLYTFVHNLLNVLVQIANKMGLQKKFHYVTAVAVWTGVAVVSMYTAA